MKGVIRGPARLAAPVHDSEKWRRAFAYANRTNAIEGLPPPSELGLQVQRSVIEGRLSVEEGVEILVRYYSDSPKA